MRCRSPLTFGATARCRMLVTLGFSTLWRCPASGTLLLLFPRLLGRFWGGKKDLVAFDVVIHHREDGGFQLVSLPSLGKSMPSLHSGSSVCVFLLVSLLTFWCYNRFGLDPVFVFHTLIHVYPAFAAFLCFLARFLELLEKMLEKVRATLFPPLSKQLFF